MDVGAVVATVLPYLSALAGAYGGAVIERVTKDGADAAADASLGLGRRLLRRFLGSPQSGAAIEAAVTDLGADPDDEAFRAVVVAQLSKALRADEQLRTDVLGLLADAGISVVASGERSVAGHTISGVVATGDDATIQR